MRRRRLRRGREGGWWWGQQGDDTWEHTEEAEHNRNKGKAERVRKQKVIKENGRRGDAGIKGVQL